MAEASIEPDDKDWTWVLHAACPECGFDVSGLPAGHVAALIRENVVGWTAALEGSAPSLRERARPNRWSTLEYAAHVRDVYRLFHDRLKLMLTEDDPLFANWNQDETAAADRYNDQEPMSVRADLQAAGEAFAAAFDAVEAHQWLRTGRRSDGAVFTVESFARYLIHDPVHHLWDIAENSLAQS